MAGVSHPDWYAFILWAELQETIPSLAIWNIWQNINQGKKGEVFISTKIKNKTDIYCLQPVGKNAPILEKSIMKLRTFYTIFITTFYMIFRVLSLEPEYIIQCVWQ